jgi:Transcription factor subunit Med10 of Mediator complex
MSGEREKAVLDIVERIDVTLMHLHNLECAVRPSGPEQHRSPQQEFQLVAAALSELNRQADSLSMECPQAVVQWVDEGRDSDSCYKAIFEDTVWQAQRMQGRLSALQETRSALEKGLVTRQSSARLKTRDDV